MPSSQPRHALAALAISALLALPTSSPAQGPACPEGMRPLAGGRYRPVDAAAAAVVAPFCLDQIEVTAAGYAACVRAGGCRDEGLACGKAATYGAPGKATHPVNCVTWFDADAFCRAQGKRLPSDPEWEWAARGQARGSTYPWGDAPPAGRACWDGKGNSLGSGGRNETCPVASNPAGDSPEGLADLGGNVREWTSGRDGRLRVVRGGSWGDSLPEFLAAAFRGMNAPDERFELTGFRCAADPVPDRSAAAPPARAEAEGPGAIRVDIGTIRIDLPQGGPGTGR